MVTQGQINYTLQGHTSNSEIGKHSKAAIAQKGIKSEAVGMKYSIKIDAKTTIYPKTRERYESLLAQQQTAVTSNIELPPNHAKCGNCGNLMVSPTNKRLWVCAVKFDATEKHRVVLKKSAGCGLWKCLTIK